MAAFPKERIVVIRTVLGGKVGDASSVTELKSMSLPGIDQPETSIRLDGIDFPSTSLDQLERKIFVFPTNPEPGYIDGSVYIEHAHHPADVTRIEFGDVSAGVAQATIDARFVLSFEGLQNYELDERYEDFDIEIHTSIRADA